MPHDFFSGKAFGYVRDADGQGAPVYSFGPNTRDDRGVKDDGLVLAAALATGATYRDDESGACGAAAARKFAAPAAGR